MLTLHCTVLKWHLISLFSYSAIFNTKFHLHHNSSHSSFVPGVGGNRNTLKRRCNNNKKQSTWTTIMLALLIPFIFHRHAQLSWYFEWCAIHARFKPHPQQSKLIVIKFSALPHPFLWFLHPWTRSSSKRIERMRVLLSLWVEFTRVICLSANFTPIYSHNSAKEVEE